MVAPSTPVFLRVSEVCASVVVTVVPLTLPVVPANRYGGVVSDGKLHALGAGVTVRGGQLG